MALSMSIATGIGTRKPVIRPHFGGCTRLLHWHVPPLHSKVRVCAVSYLNTVPLVWGMLHGAQRGSFDLTFRVPSACADMVAAGDADLGIIPVFELLRRPAGVVPGLGIACRGEVRSILLLAKCPLEEVRVLAADSGSRTSVALARVILARRYGAHATVVTHAPDPEAMLQAADAALIIGDPALRIDAARAPWRTWDLGVEWWEMTGLPMVFAVWAGNQACITDEVTRGFHASYTYGCEHMDDIVQRESAARGFAPELVRHYLSANVVHRLEEAEYEGMRVFLDYARATAGAGL